MDPHWNKQKPTGGGPIADKSVLSSNPGLGLPNTADPSGASNSISQSTSTRSPLLDCLPDGRVPETRSSQILRTLMNLFYQVEPQRHYIEQQEDDQYKPEEREMSNFDRSNLASSAPSKLLNNGMNISKFTSIAQEGRNFISAYQQSWNPLSFAPAETSTLGLLSTGTTIYSTAASNYSLSNSSFSAASGVNSSEVPTWPSASNSTAFASSTSSAEANNQPLDTQYQLEALSERWQIYLAILYSLTAITSFILNVITVVVLARSHRCVLRQYLINLSMSDLLMSLFSIRKYNSTISGVSSGSSKSLLDQVPQ